MKTKYSVLGTAFALVLACSPAYAQTSDSTGQNVGQDIGFGDIVYSSTWDRIAGKPVTATRWPAWSEVSGKPTTATRWPTWGEVTGKPSSFPTTWGNVSGRPSSYPTTWGSVSGKPSSFPSSWNSISGKPSTFPPSAHNHDDRYVRRGASGAISGNLDVSGTVSGNRLVTNDVGGDRWCRANTSGRIQCTYNSPSGSGCGSDKEMTVKASSSSCFGDWVTGNILTITQCRGGSWKTVTTFNGCTPVNRSCFVAGTPILMADGSLKNIEDIKVGEKVRSATGGVNVVRFHDRPIMRPGTGQKLVSINGGDYFMSNNHPVLTKDGWKAVDPASAQNEALDILEGKVGQLAAGDVILGADGRELMTVETIKIRNDEEPVKLYNFVLSGDHTFVAGGFAVHAFEPDRQGRMPIVNEHPDEDDFSLRPWNAPEGMTCVEGWNRDEHNLEGGIACWWDNGQALDEAA